MSNGLWDRLGGRMDIAPTAFSQGSEALVKLGSPVKETSGLIISTTLIPQITTRCFFRFTPFCMDELSCQFGF